MAALLDKPVVFLRFWLLAFVALGLLGCPLGGSGGTNPSLILEWTLGPQRLASPISPNVYLVLIPKEKLVPPHPKKPTPSPPKPSGAATTLSEDNPANVLSECLPATSVLPAPQEDGRIFLAVKGAIHMLRPPSKTITVLKIDRPFAHVDALLAVRKVESGLEILAVIDVQSPEPEILALVVDKYNIVSLNGEEVRFKSALELFQVYTVPHCNRDGITCLTISNDDGTSYLEKSFAIVGANPMTIAEVKGARDAVWTPADDGSVYVLKACSAR